MQKLGLSQSLQQKLSPQQIQFIKLLQIPSAELAARIEEELEVNPALELAENESDKSNEESDYEDNFSIEENQEKYNVEEYVNDDSGYKMYGDGNLMDEAIETPFAKQDNFQELLLQQLNFLKLDETEHELGEQIIGSLDDDGYLRRQITSIVNDLAFTKGIYTTEIELERILKKIQFFDPAGIGARDLQECLLLQLDRKDVHDPNVSTAIKIVDEQFEELSKKHFDKIQKKLNLTAEQLKNAIKLITKLNPKPGDQNENVSTQYLNADFIVKSENGLLDISLNSKNAPELKVSPSFNDLLKEYSQTEKPKAAIKETVGFIKQKLDAAKWFVDAVKQRQTTLLKTMQAIVKVQFNFFTDGDESKLKPMVLKTIAEMIDMDISTVSRVVSGKNVQTDFGLYPLKYFFSEGIATDSGEDASSREVKNILKEIISKEDKHNPYPDEKLEKMLHEKGYNIARRTLAKYREQLGIQVARLRKEI